MHQKKMVIIQWNKRVTRNVVTSPYLIFIFKNQGTLHIKHLSYVASSSEVVVACPDTECLSQIYSSMENTSVTT
jgi:hypothetical protein